MQCPRRGETHPPGGTEGCFRFFAEFQKDPQQARISITRQLFSDNPHIDELAQGLPADEHRARLQSKAILDFLSTG